MELTEHSEAMEHEFCDISTIITSTGYRVDGDNGIKTVIGLSARKSVDYFFEVNSKCQFLEFKDIERRKEDLLGIEETISGIKDGFHRTKLAKLVKQDLRKELVEKFKDSKDIFAKIPTSYQRVPKMFLSSEAKVFYIVHAPINDELPAVDKVIIARYLLTIKSSVSTCLEDEICSRVKIMLLDNFIEEMS